MNNQYAIGWTGEDLKNNDRLRENGNYMIMTKEGEVVGRNPREGEKNESDNNHQDEDVNWNDIESILKEKVKDKRKELLDKIWSSENKEVSLLKKIEKGEGNRVQMVNEINNAIFDYIGTKNTEKNKYIVEEEEYTDGMKQETIESVIMEPTKLNNMIWEIKEKIEITKSKQETLGVGLEYIRNILEYIMDMLQARENIGILEDIYFAINCYKGQIRKKIKETPLNQRLKELEQKKMYLEEFNYTHMKYQINSVKVPKTQNTLISYLNEQQRRQGFGIYLQCKGELQTTLRELIDNGRAIQAIGNEEDHKIDLKAIKNMDTENIIKNVISTLCEMIENKYSKEQLSKKLVEILNDLNKGTKLQNENHSTFVHQFSLMYDKMIKMNLDCKPLNNILTENFDDKFKIIKYAHNLRDAFDKTIEEVKRRHKFHDSINKETARIDEKVLTKIKKENEKRRAYTQQLKAWLGEEAMIEIVPGILEEIEEQSLQLSLDLNLPTRADLERANDDGDEIHLDMNSSISQSNPLRMPKIEKPQHVQYEEKLESFHNQLLKKDDEISNLKKQHEKKSNELKNENNLLISERDASKKREKETSSELAKQNELMAYLEKERLAYKSKYEEQRKNNTILKQEFEESEKKLQRRSKVINEKSTMIASLYQKIQSLQEDSNKMKQVNLTQQNEMEKLIADMSGKDETIESLKENLKMLQSKTENDQQEVIKKYSVQLEEANRKVQIANEKVSSFQQIINNNKSVSPEQHIKLVSEYKHYRSENESNINALQNRIIELEETLNSIGEKNATLSKNYAESSHKLNKAEKKIIEMENDIKQKNIIFQTQKSAMDDQLKQFQKLSKSKEFALSENKKLKTENEMKEQEIATLRVEKRKQLKILNDKCNYVFNQSVKNKVHDTIKRINELHREYESVSTNKQAIDNISQRLEFIIDVMENFSKTIEPLNEMKQVKYFLENVNTYFTYLRKMKTALQAVYKKDSEPSSTTTKTQNVINLDDFITVKRDHNTNQWVIQEGDGNYILADESLRAVEARGYTTTFRGQVIMFDESINDGLIRLIVDLID